MSVVSESCFALFLRNDYQIYSYPDRKLGCQKIMIMAKNSKNKSVNRVFAWMWCWLFRPVLAAVFCVIVAVLGLLVLVTSPLWFPIWAIKDSEGCAINLYAHPDIHRDDPWPLTFTYRVFMGLCRFCQWFYAPLIASLPMSKKADFMRLGNKRLNEYPTKTQVAFYKSHDAEGKQSLISGNSLSKETFDKIWEEPTERENWVEAGMTLSRKQVSDMVIGGAGNILWSYFKRYTPDKEMLTTLIKLAHQGYAAAMSILLNLIKQQRPSSELVGQLLNIDDSRFIEQVTEVLDQYADLDAVNCNTNDFGGDLTEEEKEKLVRERWENFCKSKGDIFWAAQKRMYHEQYHIFAETGHKLKYAALQHLCLTVNNPDYLKEIIENEFDDIQAKLQTALKAVYWRYSVYLAVKQERENARNATK